MKLVKVCFFIMVYVLNFMLNIFNLIVNFSIFDEVLNLL